jgi:hypothetical protein
MTLDVSGSLRTKAFLSVEGLGFCSCGWHSLKSATFVGNFDMEVGRFGAITGDAIFLGPKGRFSCLETPIKLLVGLRTMIA